MPGKRANQYGLPVATAGAPLVKRAKAWHWGIPATQAVEWNDPDYPERMIEIGRLAELVLRPVGETKEAKIEIPEQWWMDFPEGKHAKVNTGTAPDRSRREQAHLVFDADHPAQRIYICLPAPVMAAFAPAYVPAKSRLLADVAANVGGRHAKNRDYPAVRVTVLGALTHVMYFTSKRQAPGSDERDDQDASGPRSLYDHEMGEEGGISPALCVDQSGRLFVAGGSYKCGIYGIEH